MIARVHPFRSPLCGVFPLFRALFRAHLLFECAKFTPFPKPNVFGKLRALAKSVIFARAEDFRFTKFLSKEMKEISVILREQPQFYILHSTFGKSPHGLP